MHLQGMKCEDSCRRGAGGLNLSQLTIKSLRRCRASDNGQDMLASSLVLSSDAIQMYVTAARVAGDYVVAPIQRERNKLESNFSGIAKASSYLASVPCSVFERLLEV